MTLKQAVVEVLQDNEHGLLALNILREINRRHNAGYVRASLSPQLSRLKQEGNIELTGRVWHLKGQVPKESEASDQNLFEGQSEASKLDSEAQGVEAAPGGGG
jgi:hypothetical protein